MTLEELQVIITAKTNGLQSQLNNVSKQLRSMQSTAQTSMSGVQGSIDKATSGIGKALGKFKTLVIALGIGKILKDSFNIARTYEASVQQVNRLFGAYASAMDSWIEKNAATFGMARADAMKYSGVYGNLLSGFLRSQGEMASRTQDLLKYTTIIAANTGRTVEDVSERIRSGLLGNTESIEDLGINVNVALLKTSDAFKQLANGRKWEQLNFQTQQQIRLMAILEQASKEFGDNIQNNTNYQLMQLTANLKNISLNIGQAFMPIVSVVLPVLNALALALANATRYIAEFMNALFGTNFTAGAGAVAQVGVDTANAAGGFGAMADSADEAGEAAKKAGKAAKGALAGFDEVNTLAKDTGSGGSGGAGGGGGAIPAESMLPETNKVEQAAKSLADKVKAEMERLKGLFKDGFDIGFKSANLDKLKEAFERLKEAIKGLFEDGRIAEAFKTMIDKWVKSLGQIAGAIASMGVTIATNLMGGIADYIETNKKYIQDRLVNIFDLAGQISEKIANIFTDLADIFSVFAGDTAQKVTSNIIGIFTNTFLGIQELLLRVINDFLGQIEKIINDNKDKIKTAIENTLKPIEKVTQTIETFITNTFEKIFETYDKYIKPAFDNMGDGISKLVGTIVDAYNTYIAPVLNEWADKIDKLFKEHIQPMVDSAIEFFGKLALVCSEMFKNVIVPIAQQIIEWIGPQIQFVLEVIGDVFEVVVALISEGLKRIFDVLSGLLDFVMAIFKGDWEGAWNAIVDTFNKVKESLGKSVEAIMNYFGNLIIHLVGYIVNQWNSFVTILDNSFSRFKAGLDVLISGIKLGFSNIITFLTGPFKTDWGRVWDTALSKFTDMWNQAPNKVKTGINKIIDHINGLIDGINKKLNFKVPDFLGGGSVSFHIPKLARGGIVDSPTLAMVGEAGKEMVVPLENTAFVDKLASALGNAVMNAMKVGSAVSASDNGNIGPITFEMDGKQFARVAIPYIKQEFKRIGVEAT